MQLIEAKEVTVLNFKIVTLIEAEFTQANVLYATQCRAFQVRIAQFVSCDCFYCYFMELFLAGFALRCSAWL